MKIKKFTNKEMLLVATCLRNECNALEETREVYPNLYRSHINRIAEIKALSKKISE